MKLIFLLSTLLVYVAGDCSPITTFETGKTPTREIFVSAGATGGDGSSSKPFGTINQALSSATPGTSIVVRSGDYSSLERTYGENIKGTAAAPIWIGGEKGKTKPVFGNSGMSEVFKFSSVQYFILHDIEIKAAKDNGINMDDGSSGSHHIVLRDLYVHDIGSTGIQNGIKLSGLDYFYVHDSVIERTSTGGSCVDNVGCHYGLLFRNKFSGGGNGVQTKGGSEDVEMRENYFEKQTKRAVNLGGNTGLDFFRPKLSTSTPAFEGKNLRAIANYFTGGSDAIVGFPGCVECVFAHNTVVSPAFRVVRILQETTSSNGYTFLQSQKGQIYNNIFQYQSSKTSSAGALLNVGPNTNPETYTWSNNLWFDSDNPSSTMKPNYGSTSVSGEIYAKNPQLTSTTDVKLASGSPCIGAGKQSTIKADYYQQCYNSPPTIGAWEANPTNPTPTPTPTPPSPVTPTPTPTPPVPTPSSTSSEGTTGETSTIIEFYWTSRGAKRGSCVQITEPEAESWNDNFLCALDADISDWVWTNNGTEDVEDTENYNWIQWLEASDPNGWDNNFLGVPKIHANGVQETRKYAFSSKGRIPSMTCTRVREPRSSVWNNNYWCTAASANGIVNVGTNGVYNGPSDESSDEYTSSASILAQSFFAVAAITAFLF